MDNTINDTQNDIKVKKFIDINNLTTYHTEIMKVISSIPTGSDLLLEDTSDTTEYEDVWTSEPFILIDMQSEYGDSATIALNAIKNDLVIGDFVWEHNLPDDIAEIQDSILRFKKHYVGNVTVTVSTENVIKSHTFSIKCDEIPTSIEYEVLNISVNPSEVEADVTSSTVYFTGKTITHYKLKDDEIIELELSQEITFPANESNEIIRTGSFDWNGLTINWNVTLLRKIINADAGDVLCSDGTVIKPVIASDGYTVNSIDLQGKTPIGICVVPTTHMEDGKGRFMSLDWMNLSTPDTGSQSASDIYWGDYNKDISTLTNFTAIPLKSGSTDNTGYIGSRTQFHTSNFIKLNSDGLYYYNSSSLIPAPFNSDGSVNTAYRKANTATSDFNGADNTDKIIASVTASWNGAISNSTSTGNYPAACSCRRYHTSGTNAGDWYLPSIGELGYIMYNALLINNVLTKISKATIPNSVYLWSSTEYSSDSSWLLNLGYGGLGYGDKDFNYYVRAFLAF